MSTIDGLLFGINSAITWQNLLWCLTAVSVGTLVGVLPGIGAITAISLLLPFTAHLDPVTAIIVLAGIYYGTQYGGSTASILLNLPGTPANTVTCLDGYSLAKQGRAGSALLVAALSSFIAALIGILILLILGPMIADWALTMGPAEYFSIMLLGLVSVSIMNNNNIIKNLSMVCLGIILGLIGTDVNSGVIRYTGNIIDLYDGISIIVVAVGVFGIAEIASRLSDLNYNGVIKNTGLWNLSKKETVDSIKATGRGTLVGSFFGILPGTGPTIASFIAYIFEQRVSKSKNFGKGEIAGVAASESANNAAAQTGFIPTLTLGIPGDAATALILSALFVHGVIPGPMFIDEHPTMFWGLIISFLLGNFLLLILNIPMIKLWVKVLSIPYHMLYPAIIIFICLGVYSLRNSTTDIFLVAAFGFLGYMLKKFKYEPTPLLLGFVLGPLIEEYFRRALIIAHGNPLIFLERPVSGLFILISILLLFFGFKK